MRWKNTEPPKKTKRMMTNCSETDLERTRDTQFAVPMKYHNDFGINIPILRPKPKRKKNDFEISKKKIRTASASAKTSPLAAAGSAVKELKSGAPNTD